MTTETPDTPKLLHRHGLRSTAARQFVLDFFLSQGTALSHSEIEQEIGSKFDRVTIYRTLKTFEESGLIHKVPDDGAVVKYAACMAACSTHEHKDNHVHFKCASCQETVCLNETGVQLPHLPEGYRAEDFQLLVTGVCPKCVPEGGK